MSLVFLCTAFSACSVKKVENDEDKLLSSATAAATVSPYTENDNTVEDESGVSNDVQIEDTLEWEINKFTEDIPAVDFGVITLITPSEERYLVMIENISEENVTQYKSRLTENGFEYMGNTNDGSTAESFSKNGKVVEVDYSAGIMTIMVHLS